MTDNIVPAKSSIAKVKKYSLQKRYTAEELAQILNRRLQQSPLESVSEKILELMNSYVYVKVPITEQLKDDANQDVFEDVTQPDGSIIRQPVMIQTYGAVGDKYAPMEKVVKMVDPKATLQVVELLMKNLIAETPKEMNVNVGLTEESIKTINNLAQSNDSKVQSALSVLRNAMEVEAEFEEL